MRGYRPVSCAVLLLAALASDTATGETTEPSPSLRERLGVDRGETLLRSRSMSDRLRGLARLGEAGTPRAVSRLERALKPGGSAATAEERLTAVRALADLTSDPNTCRALAWVLGGHGSPSSTAEPAALDVLAEETAALALARAGTREALSALGKALSVPGRPARAAHGALVAHPPRDLSVVLGAATLSTLALAETLSDLSDPRGAERLRALVRGGSEEVRAVSAVALSRLSDPETVPLARLWIEPRMPAVLRVAGARILVERHEPDGPRAVASLLDTPSAAADGVALALSSPDPALVPALGRRLEAGAMGQERADLLSAIGKVGDAAAVKILAASLSMPDRSVPSADALARVDGKAASLALAQALLVPSTRRLAARAAAVRRVVLGEAVDGIDRALVTLFASKDPSDRGAALTARAALEPTWLEALATTNDETTVAALSPLVLLSERETAWRAAARLGTLPGPAFRPALAFALAAKGADAHVPTSVLVSLIDEGSAGAPLAARALAARDEERQRPMLRALLESRSPSLRAHTALGLAASERPDATGLLASAYRFETVAAVRAAIVRALRARPGPTSPVVALSADLDPDPDVRRVARSDVRADAGARPLAAIWILTSKSGSGGPATIPGAATLVTEEGLELPVMPLPDGQAVVLGLPPGSTVLRVAPEQKAGEHSVRGELGDEEDGRIKGISRGP